MGDDRPIRYVEHADDGTPTKIVYRASSLGTCERALIASARGVQPLPHPEWFQEVLEEGNEAEPQILAMWDEMTGIPTGDQQREFELWVMDVEVGDVEVPVVVRAHVDGVSCDESGRFTIREAKKFRPSTWETWKRKGCEINVLYPWQVSAIMHACHALNDEMPLVEMIGGRWDDETRQVVELCPQFLDMPPIPLKAIKKKLARIERLLSEGYDPTDPDVVCTESMYPCGYWKLHPSELAGGKKNAKDAERVKVKSSAITEEVRQLLIHDTALTGRLKMLEDDKKKIDAARKQGREQIKQFMQVQGLTVGTCAEVDGYEVEWMQVERKGYEVKPTSYELVAVKSMDKPVRVKKNKGESE